MGLCYSSEDKKQKAKIRRNTRTMKLKKLEKVKQQKGLSEKYIKDMVVNNFDKYDTSGDGKLSLEQIAMFFDEIIRRKGLQKQYDARDLAGKFIAMIDMDGDQQLTRQQIYLFYKEK